MSQDLHHEQRREHDDTRGPSERSFGITFACVFALLSAWLFFRQGAGGGFVASAGTAAAFLAAGFLAPVLLRPLNRLWLRFGLLLHGVVNPLILGILFFIVFTPMGLAMRLFGADLLRLRRKPDGESYWVVRAEEKVEPSSMTNQF